MSLISFLRSSLRRYGMKPSSRAASGGLKLVIEELDHRILLSSYVSTSGLDSNPGTLAEPFRTLNKAVSVLQPGDTLYIRGGTYVENLNNNIPGGTSWSNPVTIAAYPGETVIVQAASSGVGVVYLAAASRSYIILDGLILDAAKTATNVVKITAGSTTGASNHIRIQNSEIRNAVHQGILITQPGADYNEFINLKIHDNGSSVLDHGMYFEDNHNLVDDCDVYSNYGYGIQIYKWIGVNGQDASYNTVRNSKFHDNGKSGIGLFVGDGNVAYNNITWNNGEAGINVDYGASHTEVYNNTIYHNSNNGIEIDSTSTGAVIENNILYQNGWLAIWNLGSGTVADHNLTTDPGFVNAAAGDFHLTTGSAAIDAGITISLVTTDYDGVIRPQNGAYDIGAFEY